MPPQRGSARRRIAGARKVREFFGLRDFGQAGYFAFATFAVFFSPLMALAHDSATIGPGDSHQQLADHPLVIEIRPLPSQTITTRRVEESLERAPVSAKVFDRETVREADFRDVVDVIEATPGINYTTSTDSDRTTNISVRGVGSVIIGAGVDSALAYYVDDVFIGNPIGFNSDLFDVDRIEVLRGPQGTLFGKNALAGAINVFSVRPSAEPAQEWEAEFGNYDFYKLRSVVGSPIVDDGLSGRLAAVFTDRDGTIRNTAGDRGDIKTIENWGVRGQLTGKSDGPLQASLSLDYSEDRPTVTAAAGFDEVLDRVVAIRDPFDEKRNLWGGSAKVTYKKPNFELTSVTGIRGFSFASEGSDFVATDNFIQSQEDQQTQFSQEIRIASPEDTRLRWTGGVFAFYEDVNTVSFQELRDLAATFGVARGHRETSIADLTSQSYALFGDATWELADRLDVSSGLRITHERKTIDYSHSGSTGVGVLATQQVFGGSLSENDLSPRFNVSYRPMEDVMLYGSLSHGFKSGGFSNVFVSGDQFAFEAENAWNYEIGVKSHWWERRLAINASAFYFDWKDQQVQDFNTSFGVITANASNATSKGFDIDVAARPLNGVDINAWISYALSTFESFVDFPTPVAGDLTRTTDVSGNRVPFASKLSYNAAVQYKRPLFADVSLMARLDYSYKGPFYFDAINSLKQGGYGLLDGRIGITGTNRWGKDWDLSVWVKNIFDTKYRTFAADRGAVLGIVASVGDPRMFGIRFRTVL